jgi:8-oxo-dGTP diphosphatase
LCVSVFALLVRDGRLLLLRRAGSGWADGALAPPAGHLDGGEDAVTATLRELREETGVVGHPAGCRLALVAHSAPEFPGDEPYLNLFFVIAGWSGFPAIREPELCTELVWASPADLPADTVDYLAPVLRAIAAGEPLLTIGWPAPR